MSNVETVVRALGNYAIKRKESGRNLDKEDCIGIGYAGVSLINKLLDVVYKGYFNKATILVMENRYMSYEGAAEKYAQLYGEEITASALKMRVTRDCKKFINDFGKGLFVDAYYNPDSLGTYWDTIYSLEHREDQLNKCVALNLSMGEIVSCTELSDGEFSKFLNDIMPYLLTTIRDVESGINKNAVAYCGYLLNSEGLTDKDKERLEVLRKLIKGCT